MSGIELLTYLILYCILLIVKPADFICSRNMYCFYTKCQEFLSRRNNYMFLSCSDRNSQSQLACAKGECWSMTEDISIIVIGVLIHG